VHAKLWNASAMLAILQTDDFFYFNWFSLEQVSMRSLLDKIACRGVCMQSYVTLLQCLLYYKPMFFILTVYQRLYFGFLQNFFVFPNMSSTPKNLIVLLPPSQKKYIILGFKFYPKKQVILSYLESTCACKNQLVPNMGNN